MRKLLLILVLLTSTRTLISCCKDVGFSFRWREATLTNIIASSDTVAFLRSDSSRLAHYGFRLHFEYEEVAYHRISDFGLNQSYALSCESNYQNKDSITSIDVLTQNNFDNTHPAGSSIVEYLLARPGMTTGQQGTTPYEFVKNNLDFFKSDDPINRNILDFKFASVAPILGQHSFIVKTSFKSGRMLSDTTTIKLY